LPAARSFSRRTLASLTLRPLVKSLVPVSVRPAPLDESKAERAVAVPDGAAIECRPAGDRQDIVAAAIGRDRAAGAGE
jgi:hypothetical protein